MAPTGTSRFGLLLSVTHSTPPSAVPMLQASSPGRRMPHEPRAVVSAGPYELTSRRRLAQADTSSGVSGSPPHSSTSTVGKSVGRSSDATVGVSTSWVTRMRRAAPAMSLTRSDSVGTHTVPPKASVVNTSLMLMSNT